MQGQKVLFVGGQGPVSAPAVRLLAPDNDVFVMARFSKPEARETLEAMGVTCIPHDLFEPFDDLPDDFDYVYDTALPLARDAAGRLDVPGREPLAELVRSVCRRNRSVDGAPATGEGLPLRLHDLGL